MLRSVPVAAAALTLLCTQATPPALAQVASVRALVTAGDVLPSGETVEFLRDLSISDTGSWAVRARVDGDEAFVVDGAVELSEGGQIGGQAITDIREARLAPDGTIVAIVKTGLAVDRLIVGTDTVLASGMTITLPSTGQPATIDDLIDFDYAGGYVLVYGRLTGTGNSRNVLLYGSVNGASLTLLESFVQASPVPGLNAPFDSAAGLGGLDVAENGRWATGVNVNTGAGAFPAFVADGVGIGEFNNPAPTAGAFWWLRAGATYRAAINSSGTTAQVGVIQFSSGSVRGVIYRGNQVVAQEGDPLSGTSETVGALNTSPLEVTESDEVVHLLPLASLEQMLRVGDDTLIHTGSTQATSGDTVTALFPVFDASSDGRSVAILGRLGGQFPTVALLVEHDLQGADLCPTVPNSTGQSGTLDVVGSRWIQFNDLSLRASQLPPDQFGLLLNGTGLGFTPNPGGSDGNLCLGGTLGRHNSSVQSSGPSGAILFPTDLTAIPQPSQFIQVTAGMPLLFQVWHRDGTVSAPASNFTEARALRFL